MKNSLENIWDRRGIIRLSLALLKSIDIKNARALFDGIFIIDTDNRLWDSSIKYYAVSPYFKKVKEGDKCPEYQATTERFKNGDIKVKWDIISSSMPKVENLNNALKKEKAKLGILMHLFLRIQKLMRSKS